ncbi:hypothetical protein IGI04_029798 [Brassica rapa subsp. trilocularis]|uniref:Uncharacterized protein n=1 Tax=Brassica rapa subsp. trilocularis TaxID=1813537 RepID=A0ABQ7LPR3_BRACM|nr:hypothetical protein IGI04_029798 [Brassica rapa subsp. trilocularis]
MLMTIAHFCSSFSFDGAYRHPRCRDGNWVFPSRPVPSRPAAVFSSNGSQQDRSARDAVLSRADQSRSA